MAHGIEIWGDLSIIQKSLLSIADRIIAVSNFTKAKIVENHQINVNKVVVCNNGLDPFVVIPSSFEKPIELLKRYKIDINDSVLFTLSRLSSTEQYKGYDIVLEALSDVVKVKPNIKYLIGGKGDDIEIERVMSLIKKYQLENHAQLLGFIKEEDLAQHFLLADTYIMPSKNEGFGLVFIEAAFYGLNVIAGNLDGSRDAVLFHHGGNLVNPYNAEEIACLISNSGIKNNQKQINKAAISHFAFPVFSKRFLGYIN